ncbi:hypothetical protein H5P28_08930 [Ruficoccus amylovorans]|uniref:Lipid A biosynthesis acyltransferase n=1 Tax=Ruficoccus amylovorans TaxID=1804625 RepID=A0A842HDS6_9BACT|nr:hypothetical protein [Ruficoccus amylovorans]MBC2594379.1 hypothetical protein [Ruficoccus amylovorans]
MGLSEPRNPGPWGGYRLMSLCDRVLPGWLLEAAMRTGVFIAFALMREQRRHSRAYLETLRGHPVGWRESYRHFRALADMLRLKLRAGRGDPVPMEWADEESSRNGLLIRGRTPMLVGTFHVGASDLLGFGLDKFERSICMVRQRVRNSEDIDRLLRQAAGQVEVIWVNDERDIIFGLRDALDAGKTLAMQCDRLEHTSKVAAFEFLGERRLFPVTIYHLAALYGRPVQFSVALPDPAGAGYLVHACDPFVPEGRHRQEDVQAGVAHFQMVLHWLEKLLLRHPYQWFNFLPLNPSAPAGGLSSGAGMAASD